MTMYWNMTFLAVRWACIAVILIIAAATAGAQSTGQRQDAPQTRCTDQIPDIYDRVSPAVVYISATSISPYRVTDRVERTIGSGFIFDAQGYVLTNAHVAFGKQALTVKLDDGTTLPARLIGADPIFDIAVLQIPKPDNDKLPVSILGDSDSVRVGQDVLALGNPLGLDQSLTRGIVSAINRVIPVTFFSLQEPMIQVDTPINHGNSGGPLINRCGEVVGISTAIMPDAQSIGFAIPINLVKSILPDLLNQGRLIRPWLGFHGQFIDDNLQKLFRLPLTTGFLVEVVEPGSPAEGAGLRGGGLELNVAGNEMLLGGDIIISLNGIPLNAPDNIINALNSLAVGSDVRLTVFREGKESNLNYRLLERPLLPGDIPGSSAFAPAVYVPRPAKLHLRF